MGGIEKPNLVVVFSDELDPSHLGCYGGKNMKTPNLDSLAQQGVRFANAYVAAPMCTPSRYSLLTGKYPGRCRSHGFLQAYPTTDPYCVAWNTHIIPSEQTIARMLSSHGYVTGISGKWHVGGVNAEQLPKFEGSEDPRDKDVNERLSRHQKQLAEEVKKAGGFDYAASLLPGNFDSFPVRKLRYHNIEWITEGALKFLEQQATQKQPFFLYVTPTTIHGPPHHASLDVDVRYTPEGKIDELGKYQPARKAKKRELEGVGSPEKHLKAGMWFLDEQVGAVLKLLEELGLDENTIVFYMADHNVEPGKATCYEKGNRIPMIVKWPGKIREGTVIDALAQTVDLLPTILEAAHIEKPRNMNVDGVSLVPLISGKARKVRDYAYFESGYARGLRDGRFKYVAFRYPKSTVEKMEQGIIDYAPNYLNSQRQAHSNIAIEHYPHYFDPDQLYDLEKDPYEQHNIADNPEYRKAMQRMKNEMQRILATFEHPFNLEDKAFMQTEKYRKLAQKTRSTGTDWIEWLERDHGKIAWPPKE